MNFHVKLYRSPDATQGLVILVGQASIESPGVEQILPAADRTFYEALKEQLGAESSEPPAVALLTSVRKAVAESLKDGKPDLIRVATKLELGPRRLQRRLKMYGMNFKEIVDETRSGLALTCLNDSKNTLTDIALLLGYSEVSAFNRAFKRWMSSTPAEYRRQIARSQRKNVS